MARLIRAHDWAATPIGPVDVWPASLRTMVRMALTTRHPVFIFWGSQHICLYNDAYRASLGPEKHPRLLGRPGREFWPEIWSLIGPQIEQVLGGGEATWHENQLVPIVRHGGLEDVYWTYSYGPIDDAQSPNGVGGVLVLVTETTRLVMAERRLATEHQRMAQLFDQAPIFAALLAGERFVVEMANPGYLELIGGRDALGRPIAAVVPEAVDQGYVELLESVRRTGRPYTAEGATISLRGADGRDVERVFDFVYQPVRDDAGLVTHVLCLGVDVSQRVDAQRALAFREEQLRLAVDAGEIGLWDVDMVRETLFWPPRVKAMFGISPDVPVSMADFYAGLHPEDRERITSAFAAAIDPAQRAVYDVEYRTVGKEDGVVRWVAARGRGIFDAKDRCVRGVGTAIDISTRKRDESRLRELNETLERRLSEHLAERRTLLDIVDGSDVGVQALTPDFRFLAINRAVAAEYEAIWGFRPQIGDRLTQLLRDRPEALEAATALWARALSGDEFTSVQEFGDADRERRWYEMRFRPLRDARGARIGAYQIAVDVTARRRQEERLERAEAALRQTQKMEALGQLTGGIAHDFNNLLQALRANFELLRRLPGSTGRARELADKGVDITQRGARLTAQLLTFSREQSLDVRPVDVPALLRGMEDLLRSTAGGAVRLSIDIQADAPLWSMVDPTQLDMALLNLVINARDAMPEGGDLRVGVRAAAGGAPDGDGDRLGAVEVVVADSGRGMTAEVRARAFEPFFTTKEVGSGSGLGLTQVYGMAQRAGGEVRIESTPGGGTTVLIRLRRSVAPPSTSASASVPDAEPDRGRSTRPKAATVLVVDDDADVRRLVGDALRAMGHRVRSAADGLTGLDQVAMGDVDAMLVDFAMPGMDGAEVARRARASCPRLPIVMISGYSDSDAIERAVGADMHLLRKPFGLDALRDVVTAALARRPADP